MSRKGGNKEMEFGHSNLTSHNTRQIEWMDDRPSISSHITRHYWLFQQWITNPPELNWVMNHRAWMEWPLDLTWSSNFTTCLSSLLLHPATLLSSPHPTSLLTFPTFSLFIFSFSGLSLLLRSSSPQEVFRPSPDSHLSTNWPSSPHITLSYPHLTTPGHFLTWPSIWWLWLSFRYFTWSPLHFPCPFSLLTWPSTTHITSDRSRPSWQPSSYFTTPWLIFKLTEQMH